MGGKQSISTDAGQHPVRSSDGRGLFFRTSSAVMRVPGRELEVALRDGSPGTLVEASGYRLTPERDYDLHPDGQRVLMISAEASIGGSLPVTEPQLVLVENWAEELKRLVTAR